MGRFREVMCSINLQITISQVREHMKDRRNLVRSDGWTDSGILQNLILFLRERSSRSANLSQISWISSSWSVTASTISL